ncbi:AraC family transcriptional regulator [Burkholderia sp. Ax-1719]|uniref:helix-turn-helix domain-containing protein n=1 Tax=Burkholderia sp. Ax-1719 TaxID=2608334 RepID=UPI001422B45F|nr:AraC family transcriptional regulator [Burkholderia sp. Ax-1719]
MPLDVRSFDGAAEVGSVVHDVPHIFLFGTGSGAYTLRSGKKIWEGRGRLGCGQIVPAGFELDKGTWSGQWNRCLGIQVSSDFVTSFLEEDVKKLRIEPDLNLADTRFAIVRLAILDELRRNCSSGTLYAQSISLALAGLLQPQRSSLLEETKPARKLSTVVNARINDYVDSNLGSEISIKHLASLANLGPSQFSRAFKATNGVTPYQFVLQKRVQRAVILLRGTQTLAQIAHAIGLENQSHFTQTFKKSCGVTPGAFRAMAQST